MKLRKELAQTKEIDWCYIQCAYEDMKKYRWYTE